MESGNAFRVCSSEICSSLRQIDHELCMCALQTVSSPRPHQLVYEADVSLVCPRTAPPLIGCHDFRDKVDTRLWLLEVDCACMIYPQQLRVLSAFMPLPSLACLRSWNLPRLRHPGVDLSRTSPTDRESWCVGRSSISRPSTPRSTLRLISLLTMALSQVRWTPLQETPLPTLSAGWCDKVLHDRHHRWPRSAVTAVWD